jgi:hypothetical protein
VDVAADSYTLSRAKRIITERPGLSHKELVRDLKLKSGGHFKSRIAPRLREDGFTYTRQTGWRPEQPDITRPMRAIHRIMLARRALTGSGLSKLDLGSLS